MTKTTTKSLGHELTLPKPETVEEFNNAAKAKDGANPCLDLADAHYVAHSWKSEFRSSFLHGIDADEETGRLAIEGVEARTGIERPTRVVMGKDGKPSLRNGEEVTVYTLSEDKYYTEVLSQLVARGDFEDIDEARAEFNDLAQEVADAIPYDPSVTERAPREPKLGARALRNAKAVVAMGDAQVKKVLRMCSANTGETFDGEGVEGEDIIKLVAQAIKANEQWKVKQAEAEYVA